MKNKRRLTILILVCVVTLIFGLAGCGGGNVPPPPSDTPTPSPKPIDIASFSFNEIIVTGQSGAIDAVVGNPANRGLQFIQEVDLSYLSQRSPQNPDDFPNSVIKDKITRNRLFDQADYSSLVMRLYKNLDDISTLLAKVQTLNDEGKDKVFADPNYRTDLLGSGSCGDPYSGGGSPYSGGGSPLGDLGIDGRITKDTFRNQWAFKSSSTVAGGISAPQNSIIIDSGVDAISASGGGSTIGVFDTAPWTGTKSIEFADGSQFEVPVSDSITKYPDPASSASTGTRVDIRDHGLFVASLIKAVAPGSKILLYRVLGDDGCGSLFVLSAAMHEFIGDASVAEPKNLNRVVINLSLGVHVPDGIYYQLKSDNKLPPQIAALDTAIFEARRLGAIIVAAAGNDSAPSRPDSTLAAQNMQLPAFYKDVIGVAATNPDGKRSCFSNMGDIAAPGGNGGEKSVTGTSPLVQPCAPRTTISDALAMPQPCDPAHLEMCSYGVVGLASVSSTGYGFWSGTSFSTPLVSGLASLAFERAQGNRGKVYCLLEHGAQPSNAELGWGIMNIAKTLSDAGVLSRCGVSP